MTEQDSNGAVLGMSVNNAAWSATGGWAVSLDDLYGTPRRVADMIGNAIRVTEFTPYGLPYAGGASGAAGGFTGHTFDDVSGFYRTAYRQYSPLLARWTTREPSGLDGPNMYWYGLAQPNSRNDVDGLAAGLLVGAAAGGAIVGGLIGGMDQYTRGCSTASVVFGTLFGAGAGAATGAAAAAGAVFAGGGAAASGAAVAAGAAMGGLTSFFDGWARGGPKAAVSNIPGGMLGGGIAGLTTSVPGGALVGMYAGGHIHFGNNFREAALGGYMAGEGGGCIRN